MMAAPDFPSSAVLQKALQVQKEIGTPSYVYDMNTLEASARAALAFPNAYGLTVRYAMKASPNAAILQVRQ